MDRIEAGRKLYRGKTLRVDCSATALLARFEAMRAFRESRPAGARKALRLLGFAVVGILLSFFIMAVSPLPGTGLFLIGLVAAVLALCWRVQAIAPLDSAAEGFLEPLLRALGEDLGRRPIRLSASLTPLPAREFLQRTRKYSLANYPDCVDRVYARVLLTCACRLRDGSRLWLTVREKLVVSTRKRWKRPGARKMKRKVKVRTRSMASIVIRIAPPAGWQGGGGKMAFPADCRIQWGQRRGTRVVEIRFREKQLKGVEGVQSDRTLRLLQMVYKGFSGAVAASRGGMQ